MNIGIKILNEILSDQSQQYIKYANEVYNMYRYTNGDQVDLSQKCKVDI